MKMKAGKPATTTPEYDELSNKVRKVTRIIIWITVPELCERLRNSEMYIPGEEGVNPGKWYRQPYLVELWVEAADFRNSLKMLSGDNQVQAIAPGGVGNTRFT